jgi:HNH endonuclease
MTSKPSSLSEIIFEQKDVEIFKIPDIKTRISTVQNYFFPRLEFLLRFTLELVQDVYDVNPYETMTFVYKPSNRKNAKENFDFDKAHIGISGKRDPNRQLTIKRADGKPFAFHPTYLTYNIDPEGCIYTNLILFRQYVDDGFIQTVGKLIDEHMDTLTPILALNYISHTGAYQLITLDDAFKTDEFERRFIQLFTPRYFFPVSKGRGLNNLLGAFVTLYPLIDSLILIGEGKKPRLNQMLEKFKAWWFAKLDQEEKDEEVEDDSKNEEANIPELESYKFIRAGLWWSVLAKDNWTCCSCGRTPADGISLEVDHILPRSKGGTDNINNLQTLCKKCNIGKSNKDSTDLIF